MQLVGADGQAGGASYSADASQFFARITDPGSTRKDLYAALIDGLDADGVWSELDGLWVFAADIAANAVVNLKANVATAVEVNSPTFTADRGYTGNGSSSYLELGLFETFSQFGTNNGSVWCWSRTAGQQSWYMFGTETGASPQVTMLPRWTDDNLYFYPNNTTLNFTANAASGAGLYGWSRVPTNMARAYKNGVNVKTDSGSAPTGPPTGHKALILRQGGTLSNAQCAAAAIGDSIDGALATALYDRLQTYMTAVGA